jgi:hypothetical protein
LPVRVGVLLGRVLDAGSQAAGCSIPVVDAPTSRRQIDHRLGLNIDVGRCATV